MPSSHIPAAMALCEKARALAAALPALAIANRQVVSSLRSGERRRQVAGTGEMFWQYRRYQPGDSTSSIDWRQSAKSQHLFVREREWTTSNHVWMWCERSASTDYRSRWGECSKFERASLLLLALASLLMAGGERVSLLGSGVRPRSILDLALALLTQPDSTAMPECQQDGILLVTASDFWSQEWPGQIAELARRHIQGCFLRVLDPAERDLPFKGRVLFEGTGQEESVLIGRVETIRAGHRTQFMAHRQELAQALALAGWPFGEHYTDQAATTALLDLYHGLSCL